MSTLYFHPQGAKIVRIVPVDLNVESLGNADTMSGLSDTSDPLTTATKPNPQQSSIPESNGVVESNTQEQNAISGDLIDFGGVESEDIQPHIPTPANRVAASPSTDGAPDSELTYPPLNVGNQGTATDLPDWPQSASSGPTYPGVSEGGGQGESYLSVSQAVGGSASGGESGEEVSMDELSLIPQTRVGSVQITEWGLEHNLKLRDSDSPVEFVSTLISDSQEGDSQRPSHTAVVSTDAVTGLSSDSEQSSSESSDSSPSDFCSGLNLTQQLSVGFPTCTSGSKSDQPPSTTSAEGSKKKTLEDSLDLLNFDTTILPARQNNNGATGGLDWWAEALAETHNITDDFDTLVEKLEEDGGTLQDAHGSTQGDGMQNRTSAGPTSSSRIDTLPQLPENLTGSNLGPSVPQKSEEKGMTASVSGVLPKDNTPEAGPLKPAKSESSLTAVDDLRVKGLTHTHSGSEQLLPTSITRSIAESKLASRSAHSSTDSLGSLGRKSGSRTNSRSSSPAPHQRGSAADQGAYVVQAGRLIGKGLEFERSGEYQEAFDLFKAAVDLLLNGVQSE